MSESCKTIAVLLLFFTRLLLLPLEKPSLNRKYSAAMKSCPVFKGLGLNCRTNNYGAHAGGVEWEGRRSNLTCLSGIGPPVVFYFCALKEKDISDWLRGGLVFRCFPTHVRLPLRYESFKKE